LKAFAKVRSEIQASLGEDCRPDARRIFMFMVQRMLETDPVGTPKGRVEKDGSIYDILYRVTDGTRAQVITDEGPVEVPIEHVKRIEDEANKVKIRPEDEAEEEKRPGSPAIDRPTPKSLRRKVLYADGRRCVVCGRKLGLQVDHRKERSKGGRTRMRNLGTLCRYCHSVKTQGLLTLEKTRDGGYVVTRHVEGLTDDLEPVRKEAEALPRVVVAAPAASTRVEENKNGHSTRVEGAPRPGSGERARAMEKETAKRIEDLVLVLQELGYRKDEARRRIERALEKLRAAGRAAPSGDEILAAAISGG